MSEIRITVVKNEMTLRRGRLYVIKNGRQDRRSCDIVVVRVSVGLDQAMADFDGHGEGVQIARVIDGNGDKVLRPASEIGVPVSLKLSSRIGDGVQKPAAGRPKSLCLYEFTGDRKVPETREGLQQFTHQ